MAEQDAAPDTAEAPKPAGGGLGKTLGLGIGLIVVVIAGQLGTMIVAKSLLPSLIFPDWIMALAPEPEEPPPAPAAAAEPPAPAVYTRINPQLVVSYQSGGSVRFLQVTLEGMARDQESITAFEFHSPRIRNDLLLMFASESLEDLATREGKERVRRKALEQVRAILAEESPEANIEDLFFTSFVLQ